METTCSAWEHAPGRRFTESLVGMFEQLEASRRPDSVGNRTSLPDSRSRSPRCTKQIALQTRWILAALGGAAVLFPIIQRVMQVLLP